MDKRQIKQLVALSITSNRLDDKKIEKITSLLTRSELRLYIHGLKKWVREHTVVIEVPRGGNQIVQNMKEQFSDKEVIIKENPSLLLGIRIQDSDDIYEISLSSTLKQMEKYLTDYDR